MGYIKKECIDKIIDAADIVSVVSKFCPDLKKTGSNYKCLSPFNKERSASMVVSPAKQIFKDFSSGIGGDAVKFLMELNNATYPEAIKILAELVNVPIEYEDQEWAKAKAAQINKMEDLRPLLRSAHKKFVKAFQALPEDHAAKKEVLQKRMYTEDEITEYGIGFAPGGDFLYNEFYKIGKLKEGRELGLIGDKVDKYWERVIYPLHDKNGLLVGFAGRDVSGKKESAKWINPIESILYHKEKIWYGMHRAKKEIVKRQEAWIVEGYNDVIAWQTNGLENTIASCGTAITKVQIQELKKFTTHAILCMDPDAAGMRSIKKHIPMLMAEGFRVQVVYLPGNLDPDDFSRVHKRSIEKHGLDSMMREQDVRIDGFRVLMDDAITKDELETANNVQELVKILATIKDESYREIYFGWLQKESKIAKTTLKAWLNAELYKMVEETQTNERYILPKEVTTPLKDLEPVIEKYLLFMSNNRIYCLYGDEPPYAFKPVSNFTIEIIQHMQDEKFPMKLVRIKNIHGVERIFDLPSEQLNTPMAFDNAMSNHGNFLWNGGRNEFQRLRQYLFDKMGVGYKIEIMGWQPESFWAWNNLVFTPKVGSVTIDDNGVYRKGADSYYIPSANKIYQKNAFKYSPQKKVVCVNPEFTFTEYMSKMVAVHRSHAITGILFTIASTFLDIVEDKIGNFPLLFLYGPPSSGKDQLIECCQSFYGVPQSPIHIGNNISTSKAQVRKFAQFRNMIVHLSEYRPGDQKLDELLKGFWDRRGYERGTLDSAYATETVPILSSVIFTGNHYPDDDALITRIIAEEMTKTEFSLEEKKSYSELKDMYKNGISGFTNQLLEHRELWEKNFKEKFRQVEREMKESLDVAKGHDRMVSNAAVLGTAYQLMSDFVLFPFGYQDFINHMRKNLERQVRKLDTASVWLKWWDCFLATIRTKTDPLKHGREFEVKDNKIFFNFTHTYNRVSQQWWVQYHEQVPSKSKITDTVRKSDAFIEEKATVRMAETRTSAWVMDLDKMPMKQDLMEAIEWQAIEGVSFIASPATPGNDDSKGKLFDEPF